MGFLAAAIPAFAGLIGGGAAAGAGAAGAGAALGGAGLASTLSAAAAAPMTGATLGALGGAGASAAGAGIGAGTAGLAGLSTAKLLTTAAPFLSSLGSLTGDKTIAGVGSLMKTGGNLVETLGDAPLLDTLKAAAKFGGSLGDVMGGGGKQQQQLTPPPEFRAPLPPEIAGSTLRQVMGSGGGGTGYAPTARMMVGR